MRSVTDIDRISPGLDPATKTGATVQGATVQGATVQGATVQGATVQGATVQGATVQGATVRAATVWAATVWASTVRRATVGAIVAFGLCVGVACAPLPQAPPPGEDGRRAFLTRLVDGVVLPRLRALESGSAALHEASIALDAAAGLDDGARARARDALKGTQAHWQELEMIHVGPAGGPTVFTGGLGLRERIHSWPLVSRCGIDQQVVANRFADPGWVEGRLVDVLGLHTLEYLLFRADAGNDCPEAASLNADGRWAALAAPTIIARRATYARLVAQDVYSRVVALRQEWSGGFGRSLGTAGLPGSSFATAQQAIDEVYAALFALELSTKDRKLGVPAGLHVDCAADVCPDLTESPVARLSLRHIEHNLQGAHAVFGGRGLDDDDGVGLDDLLVEAGHADAAVGIAAAFDAALASVRQFPGTLEDALGTEPQRAHALYAAVKVVTDELKSTLPSLLGLRVPDEGAGDND